MWDLHRTVPVDQMGAVAVLVDLEVFVQAVFVLKGDSLPSRYVTGPQVGKVSL